MRLLFAHIGLPHCWKCGKPIQKQTVQQIVDIIQKFKPETEIHVLSPLIRGRKGEHKRVVEKISRMGFLRIRVNGKIFTVNDELLLNKNKKHSIEVVVDRIILKKSIHERLTESVELALQISNGLLIIHQLPDKEHIFSEHFSCPDCEVSMEELTPRMFSFNSPYGACEVCDGLGSHMEVDPNMVVPEKSKSLIQGALAPLGEQPRGNWYGSILKSLAQHYNFNFTTPWIKLDADIRHMLLYGTGDKKFKMEYSSSISNLINEKISNKNNKKIFTETDNNTNIQNFFIITSSNYEVRKMFKMTKNNNIITSRKSTQNFV